VSAAPSVPAPSRPLARWEQVSLAIRAEHLWLLRRWAVEEDRPLELHLARLLRLAALEHAERRGQGA
jgi:hypothetical protein